MDRVLIAPATLAGVQAEFLNVLKSTNDRFDVVRRGRPAVSTTGRWPRSS